MSDDQYMDYVIENQIAERDRRPLGECRGCGKDRRHPNPCCPDCDCIPSRPFTPAVALIVKVLRRHAVVWECDTESLEEDLRRLFSSRPTETGAPDALCGFEDCGSEQGVRWHQHDDSCRYGSSGNHPPYVACHPFQPR